MQRAMKRHTNHSCSVVPIILRPCDWSSAPFGKIKALPSRGKPAIKWPTLDDAFLDIAVQLRALLNDHALAKAQASPAARTIVHVETEQHLTGKAKIAGPRSSNLALPKKYTDQDKHDYLHSAFIYIRNYFEASLHELQARNPGITTRINESSTNAFTAVVFREGERKAGCSIRIGGGFGSDGITYSGSEHAANNGYNEMLSVQADSNMLYLNAMMDRFNNAAQGSKLTDEGSAEHLWSMFIAPLQY